MSNKKIGVLYIDDDITLLDSIKSRFNMSYNIHVAINTYEARDILNNENIHIIFSDQHMEHECGTHFFKYVNEKFPYIFKILISAYLTKDDLMYAINECNIFKTLDKPFSLNDIENIIESKRDEILLDYDNIIMQRLKNDNIELNRTNELYKILVNNIEGLCVIIFDREYNYLLAEGMSLDRNEYPSEVIVGLNMKDVLYCTVYEAIKNAYDYAYMTGETVRMDFEKNDKYYNSSFIPVLSSHGVYDRGIVVVYETTEIKNIQKQLSNNIEELKRSNLYLDNFVYSVAHDLKSPVASIKSLLDLIDLGLNVDEAIQKINVCISRLDKTLDSLVEIIDIQKNENRIVELVDLYEVVNLVECNIDHHIKEVNPKITYNFKIDKVMFVEGYLISLFQNLISNSIKYSERSRPCEIEISSDIEDEMIVLTFKDNGIGIDEKYFKTIFEPFNRIHTKVNGKGIGLYIVKSIVEQTNGRITVDSRKGVGSEFKVYLNEIDIPNSL